MYSSFVFISNNAVAITAQNTSVISDEYPDIDAIPLGSSFSNIGLVLSNSTRHPMIDIRHALVNGMLNPSEIDLIVRAKALASWVSTFRFCMNCGQKTTELDIDLGHQCHCGHIQFPQISPCMIALVEKGDYCLLAHHKRHTQPIYSTLAGFVEIGETLESCVKREVAEESGITVSDISYFSSQSWPMPNQLMLAVHAQYQSGELERCDEELHDVAWFHYQDLPQIPSNQTIAGQLIENFVLRRTLSNSSE